ncbi:MAG: bifunctional oligoribonuclease and phosphatase NrnA [Candidatus Petromonas sp.]|jgi:phosphoesterase RecJ-like protein|nr:bifunctional oligoribonuclease and phosphatase NrnA [Candidatus Petromonas sp.]
MMISSEILNLFEGRKNILILPHILPDGDTLGSSIALKKAIESKGSLAYIVLDDKIPSNLSFLFKNDILTTDSFKFLDILPDLIVTVDSSDMDRLGNRSELLGLTEEVLNIDHHKTNSFYGKYNLIDVNAAACGEIIYSLVQSLNIELTESIATGIYVALSTDTGSFKYSNTTPTTMRIAAELLESGIDKVHINTELYQNNPFNKISLLADALNTLEIHFDGKLSMMHISLDTFSKNNIDPSNSDGIIEYARDIENVCVAILLKELSPNKIKVGFRSKYDFDVSTIAKQFGGGGHKNASGCTIYDTIENAKKILLNTFYKEFKVKI